jgi:transcription termination factor Rho
MHMRKTSSGYPLGVASSMLAAALITAGGCNKEEKPIEIMSLEGKIEKIKRTTDTTGEITVTFFSEKQRQEIKGVAAVTEETEILLDGAAARLKDIREGERIRGQVRVEKKGGQKYNVVLKIQVERAKSP